MENRDSSAAVQSQRSGKLNRMAAAREWCDLPSELLQFIADRLGLIELLSFRGVCKDWRSNSSTASAEIEALPDREPWFLLYGEKNNNSQCTLVSESSRKYSINFPELDGATCLASSQGWLLLFREGGLFFFCPFSRAKIDLPGLSLLHRSPDRYIAVFSAPPTKEDCVVCLYFRNESDIMLDLYVIQRGDNIWTQYEYHYSWIKSDSAAFHNETFYFFDETNSMAQTNYERHRSWPGKIDSAAYHNGTFYFFDETDSMAQFSIRNGKLRLGKVVYTTSVSEASLPLSFSSKCQLHDMKMRLGLGEGSFPVSTCGTIVTCQDTKRIIRTENIERKIPHPYFKGAWFVRNIGHCLKGVWFQPRFHQIDQKVQNLSWCNDRGARFYKHCAFSSS